MHKSSLLLTKQMEGAGNSTLKCIKPNSKDGHVMDAGRHEKEKGKGKNKKRQLINAVDDDKVLAHSCTYQKNISIGKRLL